MRKILNVLLGLGIIIGCKTTQISPIEIIGKWNNSYQIQTKDANGKWSEWTTINTLIALPTIEFTDDGKILWDGIQSEYCCIPRTFKIKSNNILIYKSGSYKCELASCLAYKDWIIEKLTNDTLEIEQCNSKARYTRTK